jgi:hypothetical protein
MGSMRKVIAAVATMSIVVALGVVSPASAFEGGGRSPSTAPLIEWGQHYAGQLNNHREDANYSTFPQNTVAFWRLPPISTHDVIVINWHALPFTRGSGFPVCMMLVQGINDFSWGSTFNGGSCSEPSGHSLSGSGTAATQITVQNTDSSTTYLEFFARAQGDEPPEFETYPYDFSVEPPRHALTLNFPSVETVPANGTLGATVIGATGLPAPDGLVYTLSANWRDNGTWITTAPSVGGYILFQLALPEGAFNKSGRVIVSRPPDGSFQAVESPAIRAKVTSPVVPPVSVACKSAESRVRTLAGQHHRLQAHSRRAGGTRRTKLRHRARHVAVEFRTARAQLASACGTA